MRGSQRETAVSIGPAQAGSGGAGGVRPGTRWPLDWLVAVIPALAELAVGGYRIGVPSLWRDEAATISGSQRPLAAIVAMAQNQDAVHGPYYVLMHAVIAAGGISPTTLRLPSLLAMCVAVGLTAALGRRLAQASGLPGAPGAPRAPGAPGAPGARAVGVLAGLALTAVPLTTRYAQEARPYALTTVFAVLATYALVRAVASPRRRWWVLYAAALALAGLFSLFTVLIVAAHAVSLWWARSQAGCGEVGGQIMRRWLTACLVAAVLLAPIAYLSAGQSAQLNWVRRPDLSSAATLLREFAGATPLIPVISVLALLGCVAANGIRHRGSITLVGISLPWLVLPPVVLIAVSLIHPVYVERYVLFCLPPLALLTSAGLVWLATVTRRALSGRHVGPRLAAVLAVVPSAVLALVVAGVVIGPQGEIRQVTARADDLRAVASLIARHERPGDAILYLPRDAELVGVAYPAPFRRLRDIGQAESPVASATLRGLPASPRMVAARLATVRRVWIVQWAHPLSPSTAAPAPLTRLLHGLHLIGQRQVQSVVLRLFAVRSR
jgi:mannosyltransferase